MKGKRINRSRNYAKPVDMKIAKNCAGCDQEMPKFSKHHKYCHRCWEEIQFMKGNMALMGGVK